MLEMGSGFLLILETGLGLPVGNRLGGVVAWWLETGLGLPISAWACRSRPSGGAVGVIEKERIKK